MINAYLKIKIHISELYAKLMLYNRGNFVSTLHITRLSEIE